MHDNHEFLRNREANIRTEVQVDLERLHHLWKRGLLTCTEYANEVSISVLKAEASRPLERHCLTISAHSSECSCGWRPESSCAQDQAEEFDDHTRRHAFVERVRARE